MPIYLDNSTTAKLSSQALSHMMPFLTDMWGTPVAPHQKGQELSSTVKESFKELYHFVGAKESDQLIMTSSGAEAVNHVISSVYRDVTLTSGKNQFLTSNTDEAPAIMATSRLEQLGCVSKMIEVNRQGIITAEILAEAISPRTVLISLSWANGLTGVIQPIHDIADICQKRGILLHLDATHVLGKLFYDLEEIKADFISFNGDQLHAPRGTGGLYIRQGLKCSPFIIGGAEQAGLRAGSFNMPGLVGLAIAAKEALESRDYIGTEIARLRNKLESGIIEGVPQAISFFGEQERLPHCTVIGFPGIANEALLFMLNRKSVCASIGGGQFQQLGLILSACGVDEKLAHSAISFSLSRYTTEEEIERTIALVKESVQSLLKISQKLFESEILA